MYTGQAGLSSSRHTEFLTNESEERRDPKTGPQSVQRRVSHSALPPDVEDDPIRTAIRATAKSGPVASLRVSTGSESNHEAMSISEVIAAEEDVDVRNLLRRSFQTYLTLQPTVAPTRETCEVRRSRKSDRFIRSQ